MNPIKCAHYDYIEILCLYQYRVKLTLMSDVEIIGTFNTTLFVESANKKHEAISGMDAQQQPLEIMLTDIKRIDVLSDNPQFTQVNFQ